MKKVSIGRFHLVGPGSSTRPGGGLPGALRFEARGCGFRQHPIMKLIHGARQKGALYRALGMRYILGGRMTAGDGGALAFWFYALILARVEALGWGEHDALRN